jgi:WD40 repeat protein
MRWKILLILCWICLSGMLACVSSASPSAPPSENFQSPGREESPAAPSSPLPTREPLRAFPGFQLERVIGKGILQEIAWSPEGPRLIVGTAKGLEGLASKTGEGVWQQPLPARLKALALSSDGRWLAALVGRDLWLWAHRGQGIERIRVLPDAIDPALESPTLAFSPDGRQLAWTVSNAVRRIRVPEGDELGKIFASGAGWAAFAPDGETLILAGPSEGEWRWIADGVGIRRVAWALPPGEGARTFALSPDGAWLAIGIGGEVHLYSGRDGQLRRKLLIGGRGMIRRLAFSPDGRWLAAGTEGGTVAVWEGAGERLRWRHEMGEGAVVGLAFAPKDLQLAIAHAGGILEIRRLSEGTQEGRWEGYLEPVLDLAFGEDRLWIATYSQRPLDAPQWIVSLWEAIGPTARRVQRLTLPAEPLGALALSPDGRWLLAPDPGELGEGGWGIWRTMDGERVLRMPGGGTAVFSPDGEALALSDPTGGLRILRRADGQALRRLDGLSGKILPLVTFSPDGNWVAASDGREIGVWQVPDGTLRQRVKPGTGKPIEALALSEAGEWLAVAEGGLDGPWIALYSVATGRLLARWAADTAAVLRLAFGPGGAWLASGGGEGTVKIWQVPDGALLQILEGHTDAILALKTSPDGRTLASGSLDGTVRLWSLR